MNLKKIRMRLNLIWHAILGRPIIHKLVMQARAEISIPAPYRVFVGAVAFYPDDPTWVDPNFPVIREIPDRVLIWEV